MSVGIPDIPTHDNETRPTVKGKPSNARWLLNRKQRT